MHLAWVIYGALDQTTGGYVYDRLVVDALRRGGDRVDVVSLPPRALPLGVAAGVALGRTLQCGGADVVVGDELCVAELAPAFAALRGRIARVLLVHHLGSWEGARGPRAWGLRALESWALRECERAVATSAPTAARLAREHRGVPRAVVAEPGADRLPRVARTRPDDGAVRLLFVGSWIPRKGLLTLLDALAAVHAPGLSLSLVGDPARDPVHARQVRARIAASGALRARVDVRGVLDERALAQAYADADALVLPSTLEGYGMVLTEAVRAGLPVIAARAGAIPHVVREGAEARLVAPGDVVAWAAALDAFARDAAQRALMREAARARADVLPTWADTARAVREAAAGAVSAVRAAPGPRRGPTP